MKKIVYGEVHDPKFDEEHRHGGHTSKVSVFCAMQDINEKTCLALQTFMHAGYWTAGLSISGVFNGDNKGLLFNFSNFASKASDFVSAVELQRQICRQKGVRSLREYICDCFDAYNRHVDFSERQGKTQAVSLWNDISARISSETKRNIQAAYRQEMAALDAKYKQMVYDAWLAEMPPAKATFAQAFTVGINLNECTVSIHDSLSGNKNLKMLDWAVVAELSAEDEQG